MRSNSVKIRCSPQAAAWIKAYADRIWDESGERIKELGHRKPCSRIAVDMLIREYEEMKAKRTGGRRV